tara:strand:+ start:347 stop:1948 length:1602 start_codon:yes stop_codon:yes gene_type:complete
MTDKSQDDYKIKSSPLKISTMTVVSNIYDNDTNNTNDNENNTNEDNSQRTLNDADIDNNINLDYLSRFVKIYNEDDEQIKSKDGGLLSINYFSNLIHTLNVKDFQTYKRNPFFNQTTSVFGYYDCRKINTKIFNNRMLQMTGIQSEYESIYVSKCIIRILKETKIQIHVSPKQFPSEKTTLNYKYLIYYNPKTNNIMYYRFNYLNIFKDIEEKLKIKIYSDNTQFMTLVGSYQNKWVPDTIIKKFIALLQNKIMEKEKVLQDFLILRESIQSKKNNENEDTEDIINIKDDEGNPIENPNIDSISEIIKTINIKMNYMRNIHKKLYKVYEVDLTIIANIMKNNRDELQDLMLDGEEHDILEYDFISNTQNLKLKNTKIELINSDFCVNFIINNSKLHQLIKTKYNVFSSYEPNDYPGVKNKFCWNHQKIGAKDQGICTCKPHCVERGKKSICTQITISVFQSGSIIITGSKTIQQIKDAYNFIINILNDNYEHIKGKSENEAQNVKIQEKINNNRKIMRKKQLYFIDKSKIVWK